MKRTQTMLFLFLGISSLICFITIAKADNGVNVNLQGAVLTVPPGEKLVGAENQDLGYGVTRRIIRTFIASSDKPGKLKYDRYGKITETEGLKKEEKVELVLSKEVKPDIASFIKRNRILGFTRDGLIIETTDKKCKLVNPLKGSIDDINPPYEYFKWEDASIKKVGHRRWWNFWK